MASIYYKYTTDLITRYLTKDINPVTGQEDLINTYVNANSAYSYGAELTSVNKPTKWWDVTTNINIYKSKINTENLNETPQDAMLSWFGKLNNTFKIPKEWSEGHIFPIAKPKDWEKNIWNTRPITLLETVRKIFTKGIYNRLSTILIKHKILNENNWAGLPEGSTQGPIHILNNCIEEAKELTNKIFSNYYRK